jgi:hypothetical protein
MQFVDTLKAKLLYRPHRVFSPENFFQTKGAVREYECAFKIKDKLRNKAELNDCRHAYDSCLSINGFVSCTSKIRNYIFLVPRTKLFRFQL